jgi:hypothetical protein
MRDCVQAAVGMTQFPQQELSAVELLDPLEHGAAWVVGILEAILGEQLFG